MQLGTLGAGNHYAEMQVVDEIFDPAAAAKMGISKIGQAGPGCSMQAAEGEISTQPCNAGPRCGELALS